MNAALGNAVEFILLLQVCSFYFFKAVVHVCELPHLLWAAPRAGAFTVSWAVVSSPRKATPMAPVQGSEALGGGGRPGQRGQIVPSRIHW